MYNDDMSYRTFLLAIILVAVATVANPAVVSQKKSAPCKNALTQPEMNVCAQEAYKKADDELNRVYKRIVSKLGADEFAASTRANLTEAQRAWLKFRDTNCWAEREMYHGGSIAPMVEATCLESATVARTKDLVRVYETEWNR